MENIEIEIQVRIENSKSLLDFLKNNANFKSEKHQIDEYFSPGHNDFLANRPIKKWLRLRDADGIYFINYKDWHYDEDGKSQYCDEYETKVEDINQLKMILNALNFKSIVKVDKLRKTWIYKNYEIAVDSVKDLGDFIEIEYINKKDKKLDPKTITNGMVNFLKSIDCGKIERNYVGYPFQLLFPDEVKFEKQ